MNTISPENLPQIVWQKQKVITTELLAKCYEAEQHQIRQNYSNNKDRFVEGKHYFKLEGDDLKAFKDMLSANFGMTGYLKNMLQTGRQFDSTHEVDTIYSVKIAGNVNSLMLWTEKGAARHSKILDTDQAWSMFDQLEECYFYPERKISGHNQSSNTVAELTNLALTEEINDLHIEVAALKDELLTLYRGKTPVQTQTVYKVPVEAIELMARYNIPRDEIIKASGRNSNCVRQHIFNARKAGRLA